MRYLSLGFLMVALCFQLTALPARAIEPSSGFIDDVYYVGKLPFRIEDEHPPISSFDPAKMYHGRLSIATNAMSFAFELVVAKPALGPSFSRRDGGHIKFFLEDTLFGLERNGFGYFFWRKAGFSKEQKQKILQLFPGS